MIRFRARSLSLLRRAVLIAFASALGLGSVGCSSDAELLTYVQRYTPSRTAAPGIRRAVTDQTSDVIVESYKIPITEIALGRGDGLFGSDTPWSLYQCSGATDADCYADLAASGSNQLAAGEVRAFIPPGTYTSLMVATCKDTASVAANTYTFKRKARVVVGGESLYTKTGSALLSNVAADYSPIDLVVPNCRLFYVLNKPLVVTGGEQITFVLFNDLRAQTTVYRFASSLAVVDGITCSANGKPTICVHPPAFFVSADGMVPTVERYRLRNTSAPSEANKVLGIAFGSDGQPLGGYVRGYLDGTQDPTQYLPFPWDLKRVSLSGTSLFFTDFWNDGTSNNFTAISTNGNFTVRELPRPAVGAPAVAVAYEDRSGVTQSAPTYTIERID